MKIALRFVLPAYTTLTVGPDEDAGTRNLRRSLVMVIARYLEEKLDTNPKVLSAGEPFDAMSFLTTLEHPAVPLEDVESLAHVFRMYGPQGLTRVTLHKHRDIKNAEDTFTVTLDGTPSVDNIGKFYVREFGLDKPKGLLPGVGVPGGRRMILGGGGKGGAS